MAAIAEASSLSPAEVAAVRRQLDTLLADELLRTSKRSVAFLRYIVEETLNGHAPELKERTIGVHVFGKALTYDTNLDHVVRTSASELRKRLTLYYSKPEHSDELRILLVPGSYVPQFRVAHADAPSAAPPPVETMAAVVDEPPAAELHAPAAVSPWREHRLAVAGIALTIILVTGGALDLVLHRPSVQQRFWAPVLETSGPVLIAVGDVPGGPPTAQAGDASAPAISPARPGPPQVPFADAVTIARVSGILASFHKDFLIRREDASSFADLRERPVVLIGAFNNEWSLQLTRDLRFSLAMDSERQVLYIRDRQHPESRAWAWSTGPHPTEHDRVSTTPLHDYALISRLLDSETGHDVVVLGGLYAYGTQAAGEFLASREMDSLPQHTPLDLSHKRLQIVLDTVVTDGTPGPPRVVAIDIE